jgi:hypothetical protein
VSVGTTPRSRLEKVADGFAMAEGPRWREGAVVLTDIHADAIKQIHVRSGVVTTLVELESAPISTGFLSDGVRTVERSRRSGMPLLARRRCSGNRMGLRRHTFREGPYRVGLENLAARRPHVACVPHRLQSHPSYTY